jgi:hypothetical protein
VGRVDYYELLGVDRGATAADIRSAYRTLAKVMHPDAGGTAGTFHLLRQAYETLSDPALRADYDRTGTVVRPRPARSRAPRTGHPTRKAFGADPNFVPPRLKLDRDRLPWWSVVRTQRKVRYIPKLGPSTQVVAAAMVAWLILVTVALSLPSLRIVLWAAVVVTAVGVFAVTRTYVRARLADRAFDHEAGGLIVYGQPGTERDQLGEQLTARLLAEYIAPLPGVRIFHGLSWPDSVFADVDHAVLRGHRLVLIESKMWLPGHYTADDHGELWRNGHPFRGGAIRLPEGIAAFRDLLPGLELRGALLVYPSRAGEITTGDYPDQLAAPPMSQKRFVLEIGEWLAAEAAVIDRDVFRVVLDRVVT